jgi:hypothetical protein
LTATIERKKKARIKGNKDKESQNKYKIIEKAKPDLPYYPDVGLLLLLVF